MQKTEIVRNFTYHSDRGQEVFLVLLALWENGGGRKREVLSYIDANQWLVHVQSDFKSYSGQNEPKYQTLLAWAKKDGLLNDWIHSPEHDSWEMTRNGRMILEAAKNKFSDGTWDVRMCSLFSVKLKRRLNTQYQPSENDRKRYNSKEEELTEKYRKLF